jgi:hypothetical protein
VFTEGFCSPGLMSDDGTIILIVNDPGDGTPFGHGPAGYRTWWDPRLGLWLMRAAREAADEFCRRAGCRVAPDALQNADR